jgi:hypothetical protein
MSEDSKGSNGTPIESANGVDAEGTQSQAENANKDVVAYETYRKTLSLAKKREQELDALKESHQKLQDEKLAFEGKKDELLGSREKKIQELEGKLKKVVGAFGHKSLSSVFSQEATKEGCVNVSDLLSLSDLSAIEVDEEFNVNGEQVKEVIQRAKKDRPYLFSQKSTAAKTGIPGGSNDVATYADELKAAKTQAQLDSVLRKHGRI